MDLSPAIQNDAGMPPKQRLQYRKLYIGEWIARLKRKPREIADAVGISEPYMSLLISGEKKNPSGRLLLAISEELRITVNDLYAAPPPESAIKAAENLTPDQIAALGRLLNQVKR